MLMGLSADACVVGGVYDADMNVLVFDVKEKLNVWFIPLPSKPGR